MPRWFLRLSAAAAFAGAAFALIPAPSRAGEDESAAPLDALVGALERLLKDPEALAGARETLKKELEAKQNNETAGRAAALKAEIEALGAKIKSAQELLTGAEKQAAEAKDELSKAQQAEADLKRRAELVESALKLIETLEAEPAPAPAAEPAPAAPAPAVAPVSLDSGPKIDFNREIRPILANNCFACHGPDANERKADLRLDDGVAAFIAVKSGKTALAAGDRAKSELFARVITKDEADRMPPAKTGKSLTEKEIELLGRWIDQGAKYEKHWAFAPPERPAAPEVKRADWARNDIDRFILAKLEGHGLAPSPEASKETLLRRATFDLTGLPPTLSEIDAFAADSSPDAYEKMIDRLLASPRYGENMARYWLDAARYADTNGYHIDNERFMWPWRDWVISAFNRNQPFDQFTVDQLAGDLIPNATLEQKIGSGFNRNHMINFEGGAIPEEYRTNYIIDRVNTTSTVWLGLTVSCAQCHDHKYDPISQKEFYQLYAFFNRVPEEGLDGREGNAKPLIKAPTGAQEQEIADLKKQIEALDRDLAAPMPLLDKLQASWEKLEGEKLAARWKRLEPAEIHSAGGAIFNRLDDGSFLASGENAPKDTYEIAARIDAADMTAIKLEALTHESLPGAGAGRADNSNFLLSEFEADVVSASDPNLTSKVSFSVAIADYSQEKFEIGKAIDENRQTGWAVDGNTKKENRTAIFIAKQPFGYSGGSILKIRMKFEGPSEHHGIGRFRLAASADPAFAPAEFNAWRMAGPFKAEKGEEAYTTPYEPETQYEAGKLDLEETFPDGRYKWIERQDFKDGKSQDLAGGVAATYLYRTAKALTPRKMTLAVGSNDAVKVWLNGKVVHDQNVQRQLKADEDKIELSLDSGENSILMKIVNYGAAYAFSFKRADEQFGSVPFDIESALAQPAEGRPDAAKAALTKYYRGKNSPKWRGLDAKAGEMRAQATALENKIPTVMVMSEMEQPRETFMLVRGQYDQFGDKVEAALPAALPPLPEGATPDRLGLAKWIVDPGNPLTARVTVNRLWQQLFGTGLVKTAEDFGIQGENPVQRELLDWLATEFVRTGWDVKVMLRLMMTSAAYRQSSRVQPEAQKIDPENRLFASAPRFRMDAEVVRDNALALSGLLVEKLGGPSVRPYQPPGIWEEVAYGSDFSAQRYKQDEGEALHRRSMYTFWKRQAPPPSMALFDAPNREVCTVRRSRTNTPLQALALMNDPQYVEASRFLAERAMKEAGAEPAARAAYAFRLATSRAPKPEELEVLLGLYAAQIEDFKADAKKAEELLAVGEVKRDAALDPAEHAAWTAVTSLILNLDETITKG